VSLRIHRTRLAELLHFGLGQTITQIANTAATYGDNVIVGEALGARMLGFYSRAYDLIRFPAVVFEANAASELFPAFSRIQDDRENLAAGLRRGTFVNALLLFPASAALMALAPEAIRILVGPGWDEAVLPFQIFSITIAFRTNQRLSMLTAQAAGKATAVAIAIVIYMFAVVIGALLSVRWGIAGVATTTSLAILLVSIESSFLAMRASGLGLRSLLGAYVPGFVLAAVVAAVAWPAAIALRAANLPSGLVFTLVTLGCIAVCIAIVVRWSRPGRGDFEWLRNELGRFRRRPVS
jgi:PST family polysaccharide transporter